MEEASVEPTRQSKWAHSAYFPIEFHMKLSFKVLVLSDSDWLPFFQWKRRWLQSSWMQESEIGNISASSFIVPNLVTANEIHPLS